MTDPFANVPDENKLVVIRVAEGVVGQGTAPDPIPDTSVAVGATAAGVVGDPEGEKI